VLQVYSFVSRFGKVTINALDNDAKSRYDTRESYDWFYSSKRLELRFSSSIA
jgi:hypothetical protein